MLIPIKSQTQRWRCEMCGLYWTRARRCVNGTWQAWRGCPPGWCRDCGGWMNYKGESTYEVPTSDAQEPRTAGET